MSDNNYSNYTFTVDERERQIWDAIEELFTRAPLFAEDLVESINTYAKCRSKRLPSVHRRSA